MEKHYWHLLSNILDEPRRDGQEEMPSSREVWGGGFHIFHYLKPKNVCSWCGGQPKLKPKMEKLRKCLFSSNKIYFNRGKICLLDKSQKLQVRRGRNVHSTGQI